MRGEGVLELNRSTYYANLKLIENPLPPRQGEEGFCSTEPICGQLFGFDIRISNRPMRESRDR